MAKRLFSQPHGVTVDYDKTKREFTVTTGRKCQGFHLVAVRLKKPRPNSSSSTGNPFKFRGRILSPAARTFWTFPRRAFVVVTLDVHEDPAALDLDLVKFVESIGIHTGNVDLKGFRLRAETRMTFDI